MMMKKTTSALAVAALLGTGAASAATFQVNDDSSLSVSGRLYYFYSNTETSGVGVDSYSDSSRIAVGSETDLGNGVTAFSNIRFNTGNFGDEDDTSMSRTFFGVRGDFGSIRVGEQAKVYDSLLSLTDNFDQVTFTTSSSDSSDTSLRYSAPSINGLTVHAGVSVDGDSETQNAGNTSSFEVGASYDLGGATLFAAYDQAKMIDGNTDEDSNYGVGAAFDLAGASIAVAHHEDGSLANDTSATGINATVPFGDMSIMVGVNNVSPDTGDSQTQRGVRLAYGVGPAYVSAGYHQFDAANDEGDVYGLAVYYGF